MISNLVVAIAAVVPVRRDPSEKSEMVTQLLLGETARVKARPDDLWLEITCSQDGYPGFVSSNMVVNRAADWPVEFTAEAGRMRRLRSRICSVDVNGERWLLPMGARIIAGDEHALHLPDGHTAYWVGAAPELVPEGRAPEESTPPGLQMMRVAEDLIGVPYLWAGRTSFGIDCSGLVQTAGLLSGIRIPRDADRQYSEGEEVDLSRDRPQPGDLLFFLYPWGDGKISHVAFYAGNSRILHASGRVRWNSLNENDPDFSSKHLETLVGARRLSHVPLNAETKPSNR